MSLCNCWRLWLLFDLAKWCTLWKRECIKLLLVIINAFNVECKINLCFKYLYSSFFHFFIYSFILFFIWSRWEMENFLRFDFFGSVFLRRFTSIFLSLFHSEENRKNPNLLHSNNCKQKVVVKKKWCEIPLLL